MHMTRFPSGTEGHPDDGRGMSDWAPLIGLGIWAAWFVPFLLVWRRMERAGEGER